MAKLKFYDVSRDYIKYLKHYDNKIPDIDYDRFSKFFCGVVLQIDRYNYFAPVTSFNKQQRTNFLIRDKGRPISSIRFSFMFPAFDQVLTLTDFGSKPQSYKDLVNAEIKYCNQSADKIYKKAIEVYKIGVNKNHPLNYTCCNFNLLEEKSLEYINNLADTIKEIAASTDNKSTE